MGETIMRVVSCVVIWAVAIVAALAALSCYKLLTELAVTNAGGEVDEETELISTGKKILFFVVFAILTAGFASAGNPAAAVVLSITLIVAVNLVTNTTKGGVSLTATLFQLIGVPLTVGIVADIIKNIVARGFSWKQLLFLIVPAFYYIVLAIATAAAENNEAEEKESEEESGWRTPIRIIAYIMAVVLAVSSIGFTITNAVKAAEEQAATEEAAAIAAEQAAQAAATLAEETPVEVGPSEAELSATERYNAMLLSADIPADQKAIYDAGMTVGQLDEEDYEGTAFEYALTTDPIQLQFLREIAGRKLSDYEGDDIKVEIYPVWDSYPANLETMSMVDEKEGKDYVYLRKNGGIIAGLTKDPNSWATARAFASKGDDEESFWEGFIEALKNFTWTLQFADSFKEVTVLGVKNQEICDVFDRAVEIGNRYQKSGDGIYGVLENIGTEEHPKYRYTEEWVEVLEDLYLYTIQWSYIGTHEWWTAERGYLGPSDGSVPDREYKFDYRSIADIRSNFTVKADRQTNLPSEILCITDKQNGYRLSDYIGINRTDSDVERYWEAPKAKKTTLEKIKSGGEATVVNYSVPVQQQQAAGATKVTYNASTKEVKKVPDPTPAPKPNPTSTPKKKQDKHEGNDPQYKPENAIIAGTNVGENLDVFQPVGSVPQVWSSEVETAQGGNESAYTEAIEEGTWTPSGETNDYVPPVGTTEHNVTFTGENGQEVTGDRDWETDSKTGAEVADGDYHESSSSGDSGSSSDDGGGDEVHVDHAEAHTEKAENIATSTEEESGDKESNTSDWGGDESF